MIAEDDFDGLRFLHDMKVGEDIALVVDDEPGAGALHRHGIHEEIIFGGFGENVGDGWRNLAVNAHVDGFFVGECGVARGQIRG